MNPAHLRLPQLRAALSILDLAARGSEPVDVALQRLFRSQRQMGRRDRELVAGLVYGVLRHWRPLAWRSGSDAPADLAGLYLRDAGMAPELLARLLPHATDASRDAAMPEAVRLNLPDWFHTRLQGQYGPETALLAEALSQPATVDLRVNTLQATREQALAALADSGVAATPCVLSPIGLRLERRTPLEAHPAYRGGWIEPQDEGSQLLALLLAAQPGETVVDYCAGAGGKALALAAAMENRGRLLAFDVAPARLARLAPRAQRAGVSIIETRILPTDVDPPLHALEASIDAVLVDAPCSATGTWRRRPELRLQQPDLAALSAQQLRILEAAARLVRPGGRLVYGTCSLLDEENQAVVGAFLRRHPDFVPVEAGPVLQAAGVAYAGTALQLLPHRHRTDGFYAQLLQRRP